MHKNTDMVIAYRVFILLFPLGDISRGYFFMVATTSITSESLSQMNEIFPFVEAKRRALHGERVAETVHIQVSHIPQENYPAEIALLHFETKRELRKFYNSGISKYEMHYVRSRTPIRHRSI